MAVLSPAVTQAPYQNSLMKLFTSVEHWETWNSRAWQLHSALQMEQPLLYVQA